MLCLNNSIRMKIKMKKKEKIDSVCFTEIYSTNNYNYLFKRYLRVNLV